MTANHKAMYTLHKQLLWLPCIIMLLQQRSHRWNWYNPKQPFRFCCVLYGHTFCQLYKLCPFIQPHFLATLLSNWRFLSPSCQHRGTFPHSSSLPSYFVATLCNYVLSHSTIPRPHYPPIYQDYYLTTISIIIGTYQHPVHSLPSL